MKYQAAIFDMDNLLIDSEKLWPAIDQEFFVQYLGEESWKKWQPIWLEMKSNMVQLREIMAKLKEMFGKEESPEKIMALRMDIMFEVYKDRLEILPGVNELLKLFKENSITMAIASGMNMRIIEFVVSYFNWQEYITVLASTHEGKENKPDPEVFLLAAKRLGVETNKCIALENDLNGIKAAKAAGMYTVAIPYPLKKVEEMKAIADMSYNSLKEFKLNNIDK